MLSVMANKSHFLRLVQGMLLQRSENSIHLSLLTLAFD
ncbi:hypothetical protein VCHC41A1_3844 [Vibrio cholerae HC-41A1]|nr:hypothetical protein VCHC42A1_3736 [Vibrio cholerae HC-42A1]EJH76055.1 hypothetical protein VCHC57A2_3807 [Vibrio cholerae HC-57A2]EJH76644.1 hypothetical protein VCHC56A2_3641 [Vibrio cholerae HC-56A2]EJH78088.1 hypothetical protein VCCP10303_3852 [Vibrio cholerae CP1030(3)]EJH87268.1 hypothetical protein VCHC47A1_3820 [Vibrio cholerae HC-47A1]EKG43828.1 hypothetical protein VCHC41A1_3844 [Vibrio cholerae HC-41A1]EKG81907.1 hypothetical protein VCCP104417_3839 [Vibrio cholerae CP1044(17)]